MPVPSRPLTPPSQAPERPVTSVHHLAHNQRRDILLMKNLGYIYLQISKQLQVTYCVIQYTVQAKRPIPQHKQAGQIPCLNEQEVDTLETYILSSQKTHQMSYIQLVMTLFPDNNIGPASIKYALNKQEYT